MSSMRFCEVSQALNEAKNWSQKLQQILLQNETMTTNEKVLLKKYRKEFSWIHQVIFSENFEKIFLKNEEKKKKTLRIIK